MKKLFPEAEGIVSSGPIYLLLLRDVKQLSVKLYGDSNANICFPYRFNVIIFCL